MRLSRDLKGYIGPEGIYRAEVIIREFGCGGGNITWKVHDMLDQYF
jgi:hypothetical protein